MRASPGKMPIFPTHLCIAMRLAFTCLTILLSALCSCLSAQTFYLGIGSSSSDEGGSCIIAAPDGDLLIGGYKDDSAMVMKVSQLGEVKWATTLSQSTGNVPRVYSLAITSDNYIIGCGYNGVGSSTLFGGGFYFKMDMSGNLVWAKRESHPTDVYHQEIIHNTAIGQYQMASVLHYMSETWADVQISEIDPVTGTFSASSPRYNLSPVPYLDDIQTAVFRQGEGTYFSGRIYLNGSSMSSMRPFLFKLSLTGVPIYAKSYVLPVSGNARLYGEKLVHTGDGLAMTYCGNHSGVTTTYVCGLLGIDTSGTLLWDKYYDITSSPAEVCYSMAYGGTDFYLCGYMGNSPDRDIFVIKTDSAGNLLWAKSYGEAGSDDYTDNWGDAAVVHGGSLWITGVSISGGNSDLILMRTDLNGDISCHTPGILSATTTVVTPYTGVLPITSLPDPVPHITVIGQSTHMASDCMLSLSLGNDTSVCASLTLDATVAGATSYVWQDGSTGPFYTVTSPGTYWVIASEGCCNVSDTINVMFTAATPFTLGPDTMLCAGSTTTLTPYPLPGAGTSQLWNTGETSLSITASGPGLYWLQETSPSGCVFTDSILILDATPVIPLPGYTEACEGDIVLLDAGNPGSSYTWSTGETTQTILATVPGTYSVTVTNAWGCTAIDSTIILFYSFPVNDLGADISSCDDPLHSWDMSCAGCVYLWHDGSTLPTYSSSGPGWIWCEISTGPGCTVRDSLFITLFPPAVVMLPDLIEGCEGDTLLLDAGNPGSNYIWSTGETTQVIYASTPGAFSVSVTNAYGCSDADTVLISLYAYPDPDLGPDVNVCPGTTLAWDLSCPGCSYLWQNGSTLPSYTTSGYGWVWSEVTTGPGCARRDSVLITLLPTVNIHLPDSVPLCPGDSVVLNPDSAGLYPGALYTWSNGTTGNTTTIHAGGFYSVTVSYPGFCDGTALVFAEELPILTVDLGPDMELCRTNEIRLNAPAHGGNIFWSTGESSEEIVVTSSQTVWVQVSNECSLDADTLSIHLFRTTDVPYLPSAFTPNGDGLNDVFKPVCNQPELDGFFFRVFDRWGKVVHEQQDLASFWDGNFQGEPAQEGVYAWRMKYFDCDGKEAESAGTLSLLR